MKFKIQKFLLAVLFLLSMIQVQATAQTEINTQFSKPSKICFPQISLYQKSGSLDNVMFDYYLTIPQEDHFKAGHIFVGFRLKSQPEALWLYDGIVWNKYDGTYPPLPFPPDTFDLYELQPVTRTSISIYPIDLSAYVSDGELWVGYGFRSPSSGISAQEAFDEMISSKRFKLIWEVGQTPGYIAGHFTELSVICISITEMTQFIQTEEAIYQLTGTPQ